MSPPPPPMTRFPAGQYAMAVLLGEESIAEIPSSSSARAPRPRLDVAWTAPSSMSAAATPVRLLQMLPFTVCSFGGLPWSDSAGGARGEPSGNPLVRPRIRALGRRYAGCMPDLHVCHLGQIEYREGVALQERVRARAQDGELPDVLLLLEHPPVYTRGRRSDPGELPMGEDWYRDAGHRRRRDRPRRQADLPRPRPARRLPDHARSTDVVGYVRTMERRDRRRARRGGHRRPRPPTRADFTGVWVAGPQDRLDRRARARAA